MVNEGVRREKIERILRMAKANGCEAYIVPKGKVPYGYIIFPDQIVIGVFEGIVKGWSFTIAYVPSEKNGNGCYCQDEPVMSVDWNVICDMKEKGVDKAKEIGAIIYESADEWKGKFAREMINL